MCPGCGRCGREDPVPAPQRAPLRAGVARCGGGGRASPGGVPSTVVRGVRGQALPLPRLPAHWAGRWGPPPTCCGRGCVRVGAQHCPPGLHALWGLRWPATVHRCEGRLVSGAVPPAAACPLGRAAGVPRPVSRVRSVRVWRPSTGPTACALAGRRCAPPGWRKGVPGGGAVRRCQGRLGSGAPPPPAARPLGGLPGPTTHWLWVRGGAGVGTHLQPHSARSCELALRAVGAARGRPRGGTSCLVVGRLGSGALPPPTAGPLGGLPGPTTHWLWVRGGAGVGTRHRPHSARCGGGMRMPGGGASCLGVGCPGSGALPPPIACPLGGLPGPSTHWLWVRGGAGVGTRHQSHSARSCELALRAVGAARGCPGGAPPAWVWGVWGRALSHPRLPALWAGCRGALPTGCGCGGVRVWGPVTNPTARALACCGRGMRLPGGRTSCLVVARPG